MIRIGALCAGYGGLEMGIKAVMSDAELIWYFENDSAASKVMANHHPEVPNHGDITLGDWSTLPPIDVLTAGFPCQGISNAGLRKGLSDERSGIWKHVANAVRDLRPRFVFLENVSALRTRGLEVVASDLASIGYDLRWTCIRASEVGAAHARDRWFGLATPSTLPDSASV